MIKKSRYGMEINKYKHRRRTIILIIVLVTSNIPRWRIEMYILLYFVTLYTYECTWKERE